MLLGATVTLLIVFIYSSFHSVIETRRCCCLLINVVQCTQTLLICHSYIYFMKFSFVDSYLVDAFLKFRISSL